MFCKRVTEDYFPANDMITPISPDNLPIFVRRGYFLLIGLLLTMPCFDSRGQLLSTSNITTTAYVEVSRGPNSRIMQATKVWTNGMGVIRTNTLSYTELATGMSALSNAQWVAASDQIQITSFGAQSTNCQHQVNFAANLNTAGAIDLITPEGWHMTSDIAGLAYSDETTNVIFAVTQDTVGQLLPSQNQILYTNAFTNASCDVLYTHTRAGFEQNIVVRQQLPSPASFGVNGTNTWLQVWSEFTAAPTPTVTYRPNGDEFLDFGTMKMNSGRAFLVGGVSNSVPVTKQWFTSEGRTFLVESVLLSSLAPALNQLPGGSSGDSGQLKTRQSVPALAAKPGQHVPHTGHYIAALPRQASIHIKIPPKKLAKKSSTAIRVARVNPSVTGLFLDYKAVNGSMTNVTFQSDITYYVSDDLELYDTTTVEGGTVIKNGTPPTSGAALVVNGDFICLTSPYRPAIFTCTNDDSVGDPLGGGPPAVAQGTTYLYLINDGIVTNCHFRYGWNAFGSEAQDVEISDCQFVDCNQPITILDYNTNTGIHNLLLTMENAINNTNNYCHGIPGGILFSTFYPAALYCEHLTANVQSNNYMSFVGGTDTSDATVSLTNSIVVAPSLNPPYQSGGSTGITAATNFIYYASSLPGGLFQTVGAGNYYLADNSPYRNAGTTNISPALFAELQQKTTYPPIVFNGGTGGTIYTNATALYPQAQRESGDAPDYGYHYDPIDFAFGEMIVTNSTLTVMPGTVISALITNGGLNGLIMSAGGQLLCQGTPVSLCRIINFDTVQEQASTNWVSPSSGEGGLLEPNLTGSSPASVIEFRFTDFSVLSQDPFIFFEDCVCGNIGTINCQDCQFHGGIIYLNRPTMSLTNCLLERVYAQLHSSDGNLPVIRNNLFYGGTFDFSPSVTNATVKDNVFGQTSIPTSLAGYGYNGGFNAFLTNSDRLLPTNSTDLVLTNIPFQTGPLGYYYYPTNSPLTALINGDTSTNAAQVGLYHYTTTTNQVKETNSPLDIGYHYVALGSDGLPMDTTGCGTPDYLRDANGNGLVDSGELNWTNAADLGLNVIITRPANNSVIP